MSENEPPDDELEPEHDDERVWHELGSDSLMDFQTLRRVQREGLEADRRRQRKIERRGE